MNYENGNKNVFGFVVILESKVENSKIFKVDYFSSLALLINH